MIRSLLRCLVAVATVSCQADFDPALLDRTHGGGEAGGAPSSNAGAAGADTAGGSAGGGPSGAAGSEPTAGAAPGSACPSDELCAGDSCCASLPVMGGEFDRGYDASGSADEPQSSEPVTGFQPQGAAPAKVSDFYLDEFEVTVARFRRFVAAYDAWRAQGNPAPGAAAHPKIAGSGWQPAWDEHLPANARALAEELSCGAEATYPNAAGASLLEPVNCLSWYLAEAYCAWEGKRLPTEAEWNYAAAGGSEQRAFPWSSPPSSLTLDSEYAVYGDVAIRGVGSAAAKDTGRFGQHDLAANLREWTLDVSANVASYPSSDGCNDCAALSGGSRRARRGGDFAADAARARTAYRSDAAPDAPQVYNGVRCAR